MNENTSEVKPSTTWVMDEELANGNEIFVVDKKHPEFGVRKASEIPALEYINLKSSAAKDYSEIRYVIWKLVSADINQEQEDI